MTGRVNGEAVANNGPGEDVRDRRLSNSHDDSPHTYRPRQPLRSLPSWRPSLWRDITKWSFALMIINPAFVLQFPGEGPAPLLQAANQGPVLLLRIYQGNTGRRLKHTARDKTLQMLTPQQIAANTTRGSTPGLVNPQVGERPGNRIELPSINACLTHRYGNR